MGGCFSKNKFDKLKYPSYCPTAPPTHDDHLKCLEAWTYAVRTRPNEEKSFTTISRTFQDSLLAQGVTNDLPPDFLILLVSTLTNGRHATRAQTFRTFALSAECWSAIGTALLIAMKAAYEPKEWTDDIKGAWLRAFGALLREIYKRASVADIVEVVSPTPRAIPGVPAFTFPRASSLHPRVVAIRHE